MTIDVFHLRGTKEPPDQRDGVSWTFLNALEPQRFRVTMIDYPADYGMPMPFPESNRLGRASTIAAINESTRPYILTGYSAGAYIAGDLAAEIASARSDIDPKRLRGCALLADPKRPPGAGAPGIPAPPGYGIAGIRRIPAGVRAYWGSAHRDAITALGGDNPLRNLSDLSREFSINAGNWEAWARGVLAAVQFQQLQPWWMTLGRPRRWQDAVEALEGYLHSGAHTDDYLRERICQRLAGVVNKEIS